MEMLITQALDERDLLRKKIEDAINSTDFVSVKKVTKDVCISNAPVDKFNADTASTYQSINDMITRYYNIIQKIAESNARTIINVNGKDISISAAISILKDLSNREYFKLKLIRKLEKDYNSASTIIKKNNDNVDSNKNLLLQNLIGRNSDKSQASEEEVKLIEATVAKDYAEFVDPINITDKIKTLHDEDDELRSRILMAIKISNATTTIDI